MRVHPDGTEDTEWGVLPDGTRPFMRVFDAAVGPDDRVFVNYVKDEFDPPGYTHRLTNKSGVGNGNGQPLDVELAVTGEAGFYRIVVY